MQLISTFCKYSKKITKCTPFFFSAGLRPNVTIEGVFYFTRILPRPYQNSGLFLTETKKKRTVAYTTTNSQGNAITQYSDGAYRYSNKGTYSSPLIDIYVLPIYIVPTVIQNCSLFRMCCILSNRLHKSKIRF